jgi:hypothetical protein
MAIMAGVLKQRLARSIEARLRYERSEAGGTISWGLDTVTRLARWIYNQRIPGSPFTFIQYYNLARDTVRNARDAATMMANRSLTILNLGIAPGIGPNFPQFEYRSVVVGRDKFGNEVYSTIHYTYSNNELSADEVIQDAISDQQNQLQPPGFVQSGPPAATSVVSIDVYVVSAGRKS